MTDDEYVRRCLVECLADLDSCQKIIAEMTQRAVDHGLEHQAAEFRRLNDQVRDLECSAVALLGVPQG